MIANKKAAESVGALRAAGRMGNKPCKQIIPVPSFSSIPQAAPAGKSARSKKPRRPQKSLPLPPRRFINAAEIAADLDRSTAYAYKLIAKLNAELHAMGRITTRGRVLRSYYLARTGTEGEQ